MAYDNNNKGTAWPNASENIKAPQWTGVAEIDGVQKRISVWMRTTKKGPTLSITFEDPRQQGGSRPASSSTQGQAQDFDDSVPF